MRTPKEYSDNLKNGLVTDEMLSNVLFSYSKRAKNYRDKIREYRHIQRTNGYWYDKYGTIPKLEERRDMLYGKKSDLLNLRPEHLVCIHKQDKHATERIYDYEKRYDKIVRDRYDDIVWSNYYFDYEEYREVYFVDIPSPNKQYLYFLYYEYPLHTFHTPIEKSDIGSIKSVHPGINIIEIDDLETYGDDINDLLSLQFCDKVYNFMMNDKDDNIFSNIK